MLPRLVAGRKEGRQTALFATKTLKYNKDRAQHSSKRELESSLGTKVQDLPTGITEGKKQSIWCIQEIIICAKGRKR